MPKRRRRIAMDVPYPPGMVERIVLGSYPMEQEDKWFIYYKAPWLHLHRSWTGFEIFRVRFEPLADGSARAIEVLVNADPEQYSNDGPDAELAAEAEAMVNFHLAFFDFSPLPIEVREDDPTRCMGLWSTIGRRLTSPGLVPGIGPEEQREIEWARKARREAHVD